MCGISGIFGPGWTQHQLAAMVACLRHRGPDDSGIYIDPGKIAGLGHNRLSIMDLSAAGHQPMADASGRLWIAFNGEIYNYVELRAQLTDYKFKSGTDTEVILAAYERWGKECLDRFIGMFSFAIWDSSSQTLFAARDRFGVKPLYYANDGNGALMLASEIKALHAAGLPREANAQSWASYLAHGSYDHNSSTFWKGVESVPPGHYLNWTRGRTAISKWYDVATRSGVDFDSRDTESVLEEYGSILEQSVRLRFRADVPVGVNLSGGLDSSLLLGLVQTVQGAGSDVAAFTFVTGDSNYDELPWVRRMLARTKHPLDVSELSSQEVPALAESVHKAQDEPFGGLPTLAYAKLFDRARQSGTFVVLDGQGMDEQWAGYDYYGKNGNRTVQGTSDSPVRPECLVKEFRDLAERSDFPKPFPDLLRNQQYRDIRYTKIPRALRFNDRISMRVSTELREPFLDHRLVELSLRQIPERKIGDTNRKWLLRQLAGKIVPDDVVLAPKRPLQTPQREWLRGPLRNWTAEKIEQALEARGGEWLDPDTVRRAFAGFCRGESDNSFFVWQWVNLGIATEQGV